ncbi:MAG: response regulator transcription factor [Clostridia bacterium]|nr:response regulator transcription factor [Clostridia bacterium]
MKEKILIAEDEKELGKAIKAILQYSDYDVTVTTNGQEALDKTLNDSFDAIIMDIMMPVMDGITALKEMRKNGVNTPIILLTAKAQVDDKVEGLDSGANDYLTKPFNKKELLARIRAVTRINNSNKEKFKVGNIMFDKENSKISSETSEFNLNNKECEIMEMLIKNQERNISYNEIVKRVWKTEEMEESSVNMYMSYLQDKFQALNANIEINKENGYVLEMKKI